MKTLLLLTLLCSSLLGAEARTTVFDVVADGQGNPVTGSVQLDTPSMTLADGTTIQKSVSKVNISNGVINVQLYPTTTSYPTGSSYRVSYSLLTNAGTVNYTEYWVIPPSTDLLKIAQVRTTSIPVPNLLVSCYQLPGGCPAAGIVPPGGSSAFTQTFTSQTSIVIPATSHRLGANILYRVYDSNGGLIYGDPTLDSIGNLTVTFDTAVTGAIRIWGGSAQLNYSQSFTNVTSVNITSGDFGYLTPYTEKQCYNADGTALLVDTVTDPDSFNISITTSSPISGRCIVGIL